MNRKQRKMLVRICSAGALLVALQIAPHSGWWREGVAMGAYLIIGWDILLRAGRGLLRGALMDENFLMAVASLGAIALAQHSGSGDYNEAIAVLLFYRVGELFESCAVAKSRQNIAALMDIRPDCAHVEQADGALRTVAPETVPPGAMIVVQPGERVPLDGVVEQGESALDTAALTGESMPREVGSGVQVPSGSINLHGVLRVRTTREYSGSTVARILELVEEATGRKSRAEQFITKFARVYTPVVCASAVLLALLPPIVQLCMGAPAAWGEWVYRALIFLVISCPCALVISIPLSFFAGIGGAGRAGVLIKGANYMETLAKARRIAFDKTGTLTRGEFEVVAVRSLHMPEAGLLELAALAESASSHPISRGVQAACGQGTERTRVQEVCEHAGRGVAAVVDGRRVAVGSARFMHEQGCALQEEPAHDGVQVHVAVDGAYGGSILLADVLKPTAAEALRRLRRLGMQRIIMLTGDAADTARAIAHEVGIDEVHSELLPADKVALVEKELQRSAESPLIYVGDGINDAPVLARADLGIAMGALGSDAAIEAADVVLMHDDPLQIPRAIRIARKCMRIVRQNIALALGIKGVCLALGALGIADMWLAIFADVGVLILAILNATRAMAVGEQG